MVAKYAINGRFLLRPITGVDRYAREIVRELDGMVGLGELCIVIPEGFEVDVHYCHIDLVRFGKLRGHAWEQFDFARFVNHNDLIAVNLCNTAPVFSTGVVCIHDMSVRANPSFFSFPFRLWYRILLPVIARTSKMVVTVSGFSKREIEKYYPRTKGKVSVVPNAWQHINRTEPDDSVINRFGLTSGSYFFAMSSLAPNKNLWWIAETARLNPNEIFAVAGGMNSRVFGRHGIPEADNVRYLGYVTDEEAKTLMQSCKAFLYPTIYEGFGIPPMEALACGARIVISDTEVMHEVYGDTATYVDPSVPVTDIGRVVSATKVDGTSVLNSYSWTDSASKLLNLLRVF